jgi:two-component sensor histidine kinase
LDCGTTLPTTGDPDTFDRVLSTKRTEVSNVFMGLVSKEPAIDIVLPIINSGNVCYLLKLALTPDHFWQIVAEHSLELRWRVTIIDRRGIIIARTDAQDRFVGQPLPDTEVKEMRGAEKMFATKSIDGAMTAWTTVPSERLVVQESGHRIKNILAVVQSLLRGAHPPTSTPLMLLPAQRMRRRFASARLGTCLLTGHVRSDSFR